MGGGATAAAAETGSSNDGAPPLQQQEQQKGKEVIGERVQPPMWSPAETSDLIAIRSELERDFASSGQRSKSPWEVISARMAELGFRRSPGQCRCKWKSLVNRYKGKETSDPENGRLQCPFFDQLHALFQKRSRSTKLLIMESESGAGVPPAAASSSSMKKKLMLKDPPIGGNDRNSDELLSENDEDDGGGDEEEDSNNEDDQAAAAAKRKRKQSQRRAEKSRSASADRSSDEMVDVLQEFLKQQQRMEGEWRKTIERRSRERLASERELRESMERLERERMVVEQAWRVREEQRKSREESRAEKRDALLTTLMNMLTQDG